MALDLGKYWYIPRDGLLICIHCDPTCKSLRVQFLLSGGKLVLVLG